jgi:hypothetical protein
MKPLLILLAFATFPFVVNAQRTRSLEALATTMIGSYSSAAQATEDTSYFNIELEMVRIWPKRKDGVWLYVEQAVATSKEKPYRQRVYHVQELNDSTFTSNILTIKGAMHCSEPTRIHCSWSSSKKIQWKYWMAARSHCAHKGRATSVAPMGGSVRMHGGKQLTLRARSRSHLA